MLKFGTLGAAEITPVALVHPCASEPQASIAVIAARDKTNAKGFAKYHHVGAVVDSYADVVSHEKCNAIYNPLPISLHKQWSIQALEAGKHVLCEKSLASNETEATAMHQAAVESGLILMDAFHYRYHPLFIRARDIYQSGLLGNIKSISAIFSVADVPPARDIRMDYATAGGVTMDIGCYPISWVRHLTDKEPEVVRASAEVGPKDIDLMLEAELALEGGITATILGDMRPKGRFQAEIVVIGEAGSMTVRNPLAPHMGHVIETKIDDKKEYHTTDRRTSYSYQLDAFLEAVKTGVPPITDSADAVKQMRVIDQCYEKAGLPVRGL